MPSLEVIMIGILFILALGAWIALSTKAQRLMMGLHEARCPHCQAINSLDPIDMDVAAFNIVMLKKDTLVCAECGLGCPYDDILPSPQLEEPNEPTPAA